jgi:hypothetical protein
VSVHENLEPTAEDAQHAGRPAVALTIHPPLASSHAKHTIGAEGGDPTPPQS